MLGEVVNELSPLQENVLGVLADVGAADAGELSRHLLVDGRRLGPVLRGLELRGLIERTYTGHGFGSGHAYVVTDTGRATYRSTFGGES